VVASVGDKESGETDQGRKSHSRGKLGGSVSRGKNRLTHFWPMSGDRKIAGLVPPCGGNPPRAARGAKVEPTHERR